MPVSRSRAVLGATLIASLLAAVLLAWRPPGLLTHSRSVQADFADASGLAPIGADVRVAGVPVGRVAGVRRVGDHARLTLTLDDGAPTVHRDARAALHPRLMFEGTAYVSLDPGSPSAPALAGAVIGLSHTSTPVSLQDVVGILGSRTRANIATISAGLAQSLSGSAPARISRLLGDAPDLLGAGGAVAEAARGPGGDELRHAVESLSAVTAALASQAPSLASSLGSTARTIAALRTRSDRPIAASLAALAPTVAGLALAAGDAQEVLGRLRPLLPGLSAAATQLAPALAALSPLLRRTPGVLAALSPALRSAGAVAAALPGAVPGASGAMHALAPTLRALSGSLLPALAARTDLGDPAYLAFLGLFAGGGGASSPFGVDGRGHFMRFGLRFLTGAGQPLPPCTLIDQAAPVLGAALAANGGCTP